MASVSWSASEIHLVSRKGQETSGDRTFSGTALPATAVNISASLSGNAGSANGSNQQFYVDGTAVNKTNGAYFSVSVSAPSAGTDSKGYTFKFTASSDVTAGDKHLYNLALSVSYQNGQCSAPTDVVLDRSVGDVAILSWWGASGAEAGGNYGISGYQIYCRDSADGANWTGWYPYGTDGMMYTTATYGSLTVYPHNTHGYYRQFCVRTICAAGSTYYSGWSSAMPILQKTPTTAIGQPTAAISAAIAENSAALTWTKGGDGVNNATTGYQVEYSDNNGATWTNLPLVGADTFAIMVEPPATRGATRHFAVQGQGTAGSAFFSPWSNVVALKKNILPSAPANLASNLTAHNGQLIWESGNIVLTWSASTDADNTIVRYDVRYQISADGTNWGNIVVLPSTTGLTTTVTPPSDLNRGEYIRYYVRAVDSVDGYGPDSALTIRRNTAPTPPTGLSITPTLFEAETLTATFTAGTDATDEIHHYDLQYRTKTQDGEYGEYSALEALTETSFTRNPSLARGSWVQYRIRAIDTYIVPSEWVEFAPVQRNMTLAPPTDLEASPAWFEAENIALTWTAPADPNSTLDHYQIYYRTRPTEQDSWSARTDAGTRTGTSGTITPPAVSRGTYVEIIVCAVDRFGVEGESATTVIRKNSAPSTPQTLAVTPEIFESDTLTASWAASADPDGDISYYEIGYAIRTENTAPAAPDTVCDTHYTDVSGSFAVSGADRGQYVFAAVRAVDSKGVTSGWRFAQAVRKNRVPPDFELIAPADNSSQQIYHTHWPAIGVRIPPDPDGQNMRIALKVINSSGTVIQTSERFIRSPADGGSFYSRITPSLNDSYTLELTIYDSLDAAGNTIQVRVKRSNPGWSRSIQSGTIISDRNISHQADLREMLEIINARRSYFGLSTRAAYTKQIGYFAHWLDNVREAYDDIAEIYRLIGETPDQFPDTETNAPSANLIIFVRGLIENL